MYCDCSWNADHAQHTQESSREDCEFRCLADSSCLVMTYGLSTGSYAGDCVLCTQGKSLAPYPGWVSRIRSEGWDFSWLSGLATQTGAFGAPQTGMYCDCSWNADHAQHTEESSIEDCEARCLADSSCLVMTYGLSTGSHAGDCVVCTQGTTLAPYPGWVSKIRSEGFGAA